MTMGSLEALQILVQQGECGLDGFCQFVEYFVDGHGLQGGLLEGKVELLIAAIDSLCVIQALLI